MAGVYCVLYGLAGALIGMAAKVLLPELDNPNNAFAAIVQASLPDGIRGLVIAAALAMSTATPPCWRPPPCWPRTCCPRCAAADASSVSSHRLITLLAGFTAVGIALAVDDVSAR